MELEANQNELKKKIEEKKYFFQEKLLKLSNSLSNAPLLLAKRINFQAVLRMLLTIVVIIFVFLITVYIYKYVLVKQVVTPTPKPTVEASPQPSQSAEPSIYSKDPVILAVEEKLSSFDKRVNSVELEEFEINPPILDFDVNFNKQ